MIADAHNPGSRSVSFISVPWWVEACASRDGVAVAGVADRARRKFDRAEYWILAEDVAGLQGLLTVFPELNDDAAGAKNAIAMTEARPRPSTPCR